jgi:hypothetical protein
MVHGPSFLILTDLRIEPAQVEPNSILGIASAQASLIWFFKFEFPATAARDEFK